MIATSESNSYHLTRYIVIARLVNLAWGAASRRCVHINKGKAVL